MAPSILAILALACFAFASASTSHAAQICDRRGGYHLSYDGNFPMYIRTRSGATCEATFSNVNGSNLTFKRLSLVTPPAHGKINLREGGYYIYAAPAGYKGSDAFTLRVCGTEDNKPGCATLNYSVTIEWGDERCLVRLRFRCAQATPDMLRPGDCGWQRNA